MAAQTEPVIATLDLFDAWRQEDYEAIRKLLFGAASAATATSSPLNAEKQPPSKPKRAWFGRR